MITAVKVCSAPRMGNVNLEPALTSCMGRTRAAHRTTVHRPFSATKDAVKVSSANTTLNACHKPAIAKIISVSRTDATARLTMRSTDATVKYAKTRPSA